MQHINIIPRRKPAFRRWPMLVGSAVFIIALMLLAPATVFAENTAETCAECHDELAAAFKMQVHAVIDAKGLAGKSFSCEACHGDLSKHLENAEAGNIFAFKGKDTANAANKMCLSCHHNDHGEYFASPHGKAAMSCTQCHSVHKAKKTHATKTCYSCHEDVFAKFKLNERHRLLEGVIGCDDCHDPHKPATSMRLGGFKQETCYKCHTDKQGPFLYEHASVRIEGCTTCHDVHGTPNRHLLINQSVSELCYSCHTTVPGFHSRFTPASNCASCHSTIHGSNFSRFFLK